MIFGRMIAHDWTTHLNATTQKQKDVATTDADAPSSPAAAPGPVSEHVVFLVPPARAPIVSVADEASAIDSDPAAEIGHSPFVKYIR